MLRELHELDLPQLVAIEIATQESPWSEDVFKQCIILGSQGWVIEVEQKVVGFVLLFSKACEGHILNIGVDPDYQRQGYGEALMTKVMETAEDELLTVVYLEVRISNERAKNLYKKMGFEQVGVRKGYYATAGGREDALVLAKQLEQKA